MNTMRHAVRVGDLVSSRVIDEDGRSLGKVVDLRVSADGRYEVLGLLVGSSGWLDRLNLGRLFHSVNIREPDHIPWSRVDRVERAKIYLGRGGKRSG